MTAFAVFDQTTDGRRPVPSQTADARTCGLHGHRVVNGWIV
jgi:hypothetical protein